MPRLRSHACFAHSCRAFAHIFVYNRLCLSGDFVQFPAQLLLIKFAGYFGNGDGGHAVADQIGQRAPRT